jgi:hypothetical protein
MFFEKCANAHEQIIIYLVPAIPGFRTLPSVDLHGSVPHGNSTTTFVRNVISFPTGQGKFSLA